MARHYEKDFKLMIVDLLESGHKPKQVSEDYDIDSLDLLHLTGQ